MTITMQYPPGWAGPLAGKDPWPLRFYRHGFDAACYNTLACSLIYNQHQFGTLRYDYEGKPYDKPSGPPPSSNWKAHWSGGHLIVPSDHGGRTFPGPVEVKWTSLDGAKHEATLDLDALFKDRLVLHQVPREEIPDGWLASCAIDPVSPDIMVEVDDQTIIVYMRAGVVTCDPRDPGNIDKRGIRHDLITVWSKTY